MTVGALALTTIGLDTSVAVVAGARRRRRDRHRLRHADVDPRGAERGRHGRSRHGHLDRAAGRARSAAPSARRCSARCSPGACPRTTPPPRDYADALPWVFATAVPVGLLAILFGVLLPQRPLRGADELAAAGVDAVDHPRLTRPCPFWRRHSRACHGVSGAKTSGQEAEVPWRPAPAAKRRGAVHGAGCAQGVDPELGLAPQRGVEGRGPTARRPTRGRCAGTPAGSAASSVGQRDRGVARGARRHDARRPGRGAAPRRRRTARPVRIRSSAGPWPMRRGRRTVPPSTSGTPQRRQNTPNTASLGRDPQVAPQRELEPARDRVALDGGDHRLGERHAGRTHRPVAVGRDAS